ncbi:hypothetical protein G3I44_18655 [Halogeometricum borinquense]|uniref:Uncharacterized protein n=2 Tax=Halogeometricum borinquense TaxID=60847 RepID=A0A6C0UUF4_9EURY|nr:hypothetical protein G3I44_18655 [Halogeometricum borinquense]
MKATIYGEDEIVTGVEVIDNANIEHDIQVERDGSIYAHQQDGYPDIAANRTNEGNELVNQARRYARYHVYQERGYEAFPWDENLPQIETVGKAIEELSAEEFEQYFGEFYEAVSGPVSGKGSISLNEFSAALDREVSAYYVDVFLNEEDQIAATSDAHPIIINEDWETEITTPTEHAGRVPDARIELVPIPVPTIDQFQTIVYHQTQCQIRDYYIVMGEEPPQEYRVLGFGKYKFAVKYRDDQLPMYEDYTRLDADIPGYSFGLDLGENPELEDQVKSLLSSFTGG